MASVVVGLISVLIRVWGLVFGWVYSLYSSPALVRKAYTRVRSAPTRAIREGDSSVTYKPNDLQCPDLIRDFKVKFYRIYLTLSIFISLEWWLRDHGGRLELGGGKVQRQETFCDQGHHRRGGRDPA